MRPKNWNDILALWLLFAIPGLWVLDGLDLIPFALGPEVTGGLIATWTLVVQYYFRRAPQ